MGGWRFVVSERRLRNVCTHSFERYLVITKYLSRFRNDGVGKSQLKFVINGRPLFSF